MKKGMGNVFTGDGTAILRSSEPQEGLAICGAKAILSSLSYIKTQAIPGIKLLTSHIAVKCCTC